jgi:hypothetical protein
MVWRRKVTFLRNAQAQASQVAACEVKRGIYPSAVAWSSMGPLRMTGPSGRSKHCHVPNLYRTLFSYTSLAGPAFPRCGRGMLKLSITADTLPLVVGPKTDQASDESNIV